MRHNLCIWWCGESRRSGFRTLQSDLNVNAAFCVSTAGRRRRRRPADWMQNRKPDKAAFVQQNLVRPDTGAADSLTNESRLQTEPGSSAGKLELHKDGGAELLVSEQICLMRLKAQTMSTSIFSPTSENQTKWRKHEEKLNVRGSVSWEEWVWKLSQKVRAIIWVI